ncbi:MULTISPECIES: hypothetical protein [Furfurilactobacillus]|uniref:Uncharacterized protein n=1 Tax=Furfurilactobacillus milii TaxID=2888272 RepID=A0ABT6DAX2_9LACO|nr:MULTISPECIES: hypothetical protein [Furfurilactobacillus]MCF6161403.1 hypothetical protein [Furfurilactobacillus milii]MCH4011671.1 hypothetical protein [Furfurilactobacillus sp.]MCH4037563.1 hypothetical protein [Furfurilactobacillus sp.]MCH4115801.1 hypothetical protein [Furfurilactobacillus sp.]MCI1510768.1 hypothetical protein [Furfurilactobacillus sp.]
MSIVTILRQSSLESVFISTIYLLVQTYWFGKSLYKRSTGSQIGHLINNSLFLSRKKAPVTKVTDAINNHLFNYQQS